MLYTKKVSMKLMAVILAAVILSVTVTPITATAITQTDIADIPVDFFEVASYNTETGEVSYKTYDTSLTVNAMRAGTVEFSTPAFAGIDSDEIISEEIESDNLVSPSSIIGSDNRSPISSPSSHFPERAICRIVTYWDRNNDGVIDNVVGVATGFLEGPSAVVSNGHVVYDHDLGMWCKYAEVTFAQNGANSKPYGTQTSTTIHTSVAWIEDGDFGQDWSIIEINDDIGNRIGWFGKSWTSGTLNNTAVILTGYPGDKPQTMWTSSGTIRNTYAAWVEYDCDMVGGQSGSPVYNSSGQVLAINSAEGGTYNGGVRITEWLYNLLEEYRP